jgi:hypothetical protein
MFFYEKKSAKINVEKFSCSKKMLYLSVIFWDRNLTLN